MRRKDMCACVFRALVRAAIPTKGMEAQPIFAGVLITRLHADRDFHAACRFCPEKQNRIRALRLVIVQHVAGSVPDNQVDAATGVIAKRQAEIRLAAFDWK